LLALVIDPSERDSPVELSLGTSPRNGRNHRLQAPLGHLLAQRRRDSLDPLVSLAHRRAFDAESDGMDPPAFITAKRVFFLHGEDARGKVILNDWNDAAAICEASQRPTMRFVAAKSLEQQDLLAIHRVRERLVGQRTGLCNQIRGLLAEYGVVLPQSIARLRRALPEVLEDAENELTVRARQLIASLFEELRSLEERIKPYERDIEQASVDSWTCPKHSRHRAHRLDGARRDDGRSQGV
jgi:hypothetical protein